MILDEGYDKIKKLKTDAEHSEMLTVNKSLWNKTLIRFERLHTLGCVTVGVWIFILLATLSYSFSFYVYFGVIILGLFYRYFNIKQSNQLSKHMDYEYEIGHDRVVRYGDVKYRILHFHEIIMVEDKRFGLILWKEKPFGNSSALRALKHTDERFMLIPKTLLSYDQVRVYLMDAILQK